MTATISATQPPRFRLGTVEARGGRTMDLAPGYELGRLAGAEVVELATTLGITEYSVEAVNGVIDRLGDCLDRLVAAGADHLVVAGVPVSAQLGRARLVGLLEHHSARLGLPITAPLEALLRAMGHLGLHRVAVASRWAGPLNDAVARYLADGGLEVVAITERGQWAAAAAAMTLDEGWALSLEVAREAARSGAEAVFVAGGAALSLHTVPVLEQEFAIAAFTNLTVQLWEAYFAPGLLAPIEGWGRLLAAR
jgi:maleate cis-trans isomerase